MELGANETVGEVLGMNDKVGAELIVGALEGEAEGDVVGAHVFFLLPSLQESRASWSKRGLRKPPDLAPRAWVRRDRNAMVV